MKKAIIAILILSVVATIAFADEGEEADVQAAPQVQTEPVETQVQAEPQPTVEEVGKIIVTDVTAKTGASGFITGKVASVTPADMLTRPRSKIVITDSDGNSTEFTVKALAVIYDAAGKLLTLDDVGQGMEVQVNYMVGGDRTKEAVAIKVLK